MLHEERIGGAEAEVRRPFEDCLSNHRETDASRGDSNGSGERWMD